MASTNATLVAVAVTPASPLQVVVRDVVRVVNVACITLPVPTKVAEPTASTGKQPVPATSIPLTAHLFYTVRASDPAFFTARIACL